MTDRKVKRAFRVGQLKKPHHQDQLKQSDFSRVTVLQVATTTKIATFTMMIFILQVSYIILKGFGALEEGEGEVTSISEWWGRAT